VRAKDAITAHRCGSLRMHRGRDCAAARLAHLEEIARCDGGGVTGVHTHTLFYTGGQAAGCNGVACGASMRGRYDITTYKVV